MSRASPESLAVFAKWISLIGGIGLMVTGLISIIVWANRGYGVGFGIYALIISVPIIMTEIPWPNCWIALVGPVLNDLRIRGIVWIVFSIPAFWVWVIIIAAVLVIIGGIFHLIAGFQGAGPAEKK
ncbi:hypothetical protein M0811_03512 [Anaeramoeba ignava]|uniref:Uncharacterized protein n=1 Tax=Anaeramoeba ignava TaxID=1746090 RepID=A0A9Q0R4W4_ANAIG|nr:hypothetical protein M0811_03512 [Anaeramoeba ignava]